MKKLAIAALALGALITQAEARPWWSLNFAQGKCEAGAYGQKSPDAAEQAFRRGGVVPDIDIGKDEAGDDTVTMHVMYQGQALVFMFFTTLASCDRQRKIEIEDGAIVDRSKLQ